MQSEAFRKALAETFVVVPAYNEGRVIRDVITGLSSEFPNIVVVNDGSSDDTAALLADLPVIVVRHPINLGQGAALQTGFTYCLGDPDMRYVVTFDADGQHQVADVLVMLDRIRRGDVRVVFGSRFLDDRTSATALKKLVLRMAVGYTNLTTHTKLTDAHNGLRVLERSVVERLDITQNRMAHASEIVAQIGRMEFDGRQVDYTEEPVHILYTDYSMSKGQSLWNSVNILAELIWR